MTLAVAPASVIAWRGPEADTFNRVERAGFTLRRYSDQDCYWLSWRHLSQLCLTLADVDAALLPGSPWRLACAKVTGKVETVKPSAVVAALTVVTEQPKPVYVPAPKPVRGPVPCPQCDYSTRQLGRLARHIREEHPVEAARNTETHRAEFKRLTALEPSPALKFARDVVAEAAVPAPGITRATVTRPADKAGVLRHAPPPAPAKPEPVARRTRPCRWCYDPVPLEATICPHPRCGKKLKGN